MWAGHETALSYYYNIFLETCINKWKINIKAYHKIELTENTVLLPRWFGYEPLHSTHRGRLLFKNPTYYQQFGWTDEPRDDKLGYYWPTEAGKIKPEIEERPCQLFCIS
jgi:hypothetical protein